LLLLAKQQQQNIVNTISVCYVWALQNTQKNYMVSFSGKICGEKAHYKKVEMMKRHKSSSFQTKLTANFEKM
jgi:hypothetical protein